MASSAAKRKESSEQSELAASHDDKSRRIEEVIGPGSKTGTKYLPDGFRRKNILMHKNHVYKLKCLCYWNNSREYEAMYDIFEEYLKNHKIKEIPPRRSSLPKK